MSIQTAITELVELCAEQQLHPTELTSYIKKTYEEFNHVELQMETQRELNSSGAWLWLTTGGLHIPRVDYHTMDTFPTDRV